MTTLAVPMRIMLGVLAFLVVIATTVLLVGLRSSADAAVPASTSTASTTAATGSPAAAPPVPATAPQTGASPNASATQSASAASSVPVTLSGAVAPVKNRPLPANDPNAHDGNLGVATIGGVTVRTLAPNDETTARNIPITSAAEVATLPVAAGTPKAATRSSKSRNVPLLPPDGQHGKRAVYSKAYMTVWLVDAQDKLVARYPVVGRFDRPAPGIYHVFSKSPVAYNPNSKVTFKHMARFTYGPDTRSPIGFHEIPVYSNGTPMHSTNALGLAIARGGCVRLAPDAAAAVYSFLKVGDKVVVLPSA